MSFEMNEQQEFHSDFYTCKITNTTFILYEHILKDDFYTEKSIKKIVKNWRANALKNGLAEIFRESKKEDKYLKKNQIAPYAALRLLVLMYTSSVCKDEFEFRHYNYAINNLETSEIFFWAWKISSIGTKAIYSLKQMYR